MNISEDDLEIRAEWALLELLRQVPKVRVARRKGGSKGRESLESGSQRPDLVLNLRTPSGSRTLIAEVKSSGEPRWARVAVNSLVRFRQQIERSYAVFVAPYVSEQAARICEADDIGYVDLSGNCRIAFDQVYIERTGAPNRYSRDRYLQSLYRPKAERVLRVLLNFGRRKWNDDSVVKETGDEIRRKWRDRALATEAQVSIGHLSNVKRQLADREWIMKLDGGWVLSEPELLLEEWVENYDPRKNLVRGFYSPQAPDRIESMLQKAGEETGKPFAFTSFSAAARWAPMVLHQKVTLYVDSVKAILTRTSDLREVDTGANVELIIPYDEGVFYLRRKRRDIDVVSAVQAYLDVSRERIRGQEAADALLNYIRHYVWRREADGSDELQ